MSNTVKLQLNQFVDVACPSPECAYRSVIVQQLPSAKNHWKALLRCGRMHTWFVDPESLTPVVTYIVCRGPAPGRWTFRAAVADFAVAERVLQRWAREHPNDYASIENRVDGSVVQSVLLGRLLPNHQR